MSSQNWTASIVAGAVLAVCSYLVNRIDNISEQVALIRVDVAALKVQEIVRRN